MWRKAQGAGHFIAMLLARAKGTYVWLQLEVPRERNRGALYK